MGITQQLTNLKNLVKLALVEQLRMTSLTRLQLNRHLLPIGNVDPQVYVPETSRPNLPKDGRITHWHKIESNGPT